MRYFIIAGEQSGDLHGSNLIKELYNCDSEAQIWCWGGDLMEAAGAKLLMHYKRTAFMGFLVILKNLKQIFKNFSLCKKDIERVNPDTIILIDYAGFNLRMARFAHKRGYRVLYYISPKFWAWGERRVLRVKRYVDKMFIIFPFEEPFYKRWDIPVKYVGNPLFDEIRRKQTLILSKEVIRQQLQLDDRPILAILAGSRRHEVASILPTMVKVVKYFPNYQFILAGVKNLPDELYNGIIGDEPIKVVKEKTYEILTIAEAAMVTSGTATLETSLLGVPQVVCYNGDLPSLLISKMLIKVDYISLVNLITNRETVRELIAFDLTEQNLLKELSAIVKGGDKREAILSDYADIYRRLGGQGASKAVAAEIVQLSKN